MILDILLLSLIGLGTFWGYKKGLLIELISVFSLIIAVMMAFKLLHTAVGFLQPYLSMSKATVAIAFVMVFVAVFVLIYLLGKFFTTVLHYTLLGSFDKFAGALLGTVKTTFFTSTILWLFNFTPISKMYATQVKDSYLYSFILSFAHQLITWISKIIPFTDLFQTIHRQIQ